jgi:hypothetical protein
MESKVIKEFAVIDKKLVSRLHSIDGTKLLAYAVLFLAKTELEMKYLSASEICHCLDEVDIDVKQISVTRSLTRTTGEVKTEKRENGTSYYKLMKKGSDQVEGIFSSDDGDVSILMVEEGKPRSGRKLLTELLSELNGIVRIFDPYFGARTMDTLEVIPGSCDVRFLSKNITEEGRKFRQALKEFQNEYKHIDLKKALKSEPAHDRYIITEDRLMLLGHGIKDIGSKESFIVILDKSYADDMIVALTATFDKRWKAAAPV